MASVTLALGAEADIASGREVHEGFGDLKDWFHRQHPGNVKPIYRPLIGSVPSAAAGTNICYFGVTPPAQKEWHVISWSLGVNDDHTPQATMAAAMYGGDPFNPMLGTCRAPGLAIPSYNTTGEKRIIIHSTEYLFFMFYAATLGMTLWANVWVAEYDVKSFERQGI